MFPITPIQTGTPIQTRFGEVLIEISGLTLTVTIKDQTESSTFHLPIGTTAADLYLCAGKCHIWAGNSEIVALEELPGAEDRGIDWLLQSLFTGAPTYDGLPLRNGVFIEVIVPVGGAFYDAYDGLAPMGPDLVYDPYLGSGDVFSGLGKGRANPATGLLLALMLAATMRQDDASNRVHEDVIDQQV